MATANSNKPDVQASSFKVAANIALVKADMTVTELARRLKRQRNTVSIAINHETMCPGVKDEIRRELGLTV